MEQQTQPEPTGVSLKAAYLLLRELKRYPQLPSMEELALILDGTINYEWAIRIIRLTGEQQALSLDEDDGIVQFNEWAANHLLGPDMSNALDPKPNPQQDSFVATLPSPRPGLFTAAPKAEKESAA